TCTSNRISGSCQKVQTASPTGCASTRIAACAAKNCITWTIPCSACWCAWCRGKQSSRKMPSCCSRHSRQNKKRPQHCGLFFTDKNVCYTTCPAHQPDAQAHWKL